MAKLIPWDPFRELWRPLSWGWPRFVWPEALEVEEEELRVPAIDMYEEGNNLVIKTALPGIKSEDVHIEVGNDRVRIYGESKVTEETKKKGFLRQEMRWGKFEREMPLEVEVNPESAEARFENGILTLTVAKSGKTQVKKVPVKVSKK